jgi:hypothetical protein
MGKALSRTDDSSSSFTTNPALDAILLLLRERWFPPYITRKSSKHVEWLSVVKMLTNIDAKGITLAD